MVNVVIVRLISIFQGYRWNFWPTGFLQVTLIPILEMLVFIVKKSQRKVFKKITNNLIFFLLNNFLVRLPFWKNQNTVFSYHLDHGPVTKWLKYQVLILSESFIHLRLVLQFLSQLFFLITNSNFGSKKVSKKYSN